MKFLTKWLPFKGWGKIWIDSDLNDIRANGRLDSFHPNKNSAGQKNNEVQDFSHAEVWLLTFSPFPLHPFPFPYIPLPFEATKVNTLEKREAAASKGAAILDLVQRYREKVPVFRFPSGGGVWWRLCCFGRAVLFWQIYPFFFGEGRV